MFPESSSLTLLLEKWRTCLNRVFNGQTFMVKVSWKNFCHYYPVIIKISIFTPVWMLKPYYYSLVRLTEPLRTTHPSRRDDHSAISTARYTLGDGNTAKSIRTCLSTHRNYKTPHQSLFLEMGMFNLVTWLQSNLYFNLRMSVCGFSRYFSPFPSATQ